MVKGAKGFTYIMSFNSYNYLLRRGGPLEVHFASKKLEAQRG
jgi:hypothetical protein